jgi:hypothetical protein
MSTTCQAISLPGATPDPVARNAGICRGTCQAGVCNLGGCGAGPVCCFVQPANAEPVPLLNPGTVQVQAAGIADKVPAGVTMTNNPQVTPLVTAQGTLAAAVNPQGPAVSQMAFEAATGPQAATTSATDALLDSFFAPATDARSGLPTMLCYGQPVPVVAP